MGSVNPNLTFLISAKRSLLSI